MNDPQESMGINDRIQLAQAENHARANCRYWMEQGVTLIDPDTTLLKLTALLVQTQ